MIASLTLPDVRRIVSDVANELSRPLDVVAAIPASDRDSAYTEVILVVRGCHVEPCRLMLGVTRDTPEEELRAVVRAKLHEHLDTNTSLSDA